MPAAHQTSFDPAPILGVASRAALDAKPEAADRQAPQKMKPPAAVKRPVYDSGHRANSIESRHHNQLQATASRKAPRPPAALLPLPRDEPYDGL